MKKFIKPSSFLLLLLINLKFTYILAQEPQGLETKIYENARIFESLLKSIGDKNVSKEIRQNAMDQASELFIDDNVLIEVISKRTNAKKKMKIREYLNRVYDYGYNTVKIEWKHMQVIDDIRLDDDGFYYGNLRVYQIFEGNKGNISYRDITEKDLRVKISKTSIPSGPSYYELKFGDMIVHRLVPENNNKPTSQAPPKSNRSKIDEKRP